MNEIERFELHGARIMHELDKYNFLSMNVCAEVLGVNRSTVDSMLRGGVINKWKSYGPSGKKSSGDTMLKHDIPVSNILRLAYAISLRREYGKGIKSWREAADMLYLNRLNIDRSARLEFLESEYWEGIVRRSLKREIILSQYPIMNIEFCRYLCEKKG